MDFEKLERKICDFINSCVDNAKAKGVVIGLSGGHTNSCAQITHSRFTHAFART